MTIVRGRHVVVTGGSEGIGEAVAETARRRGARVSIIARRSDVLREAAARIGPGVAHATADVADAEQLGDAITKLEAEHGPTDVMVANAGYAQPATFLDTSLEEFTRQMSVNYLGAVNAIRAVLPEMIARRSGHLVLVSSTAGLIGVYGYSAYSATKFAVRGLAESLRSEVHPFGVMVSVAYPPDTETPGFRMERRTKPPETARISGAITPRSADVVAAAIVDGIERDRFAITAEAATATLVRGAGILGPLIRRRMDHDVRQVQRDHDDRQRRWWSR